MKKLPSQIFMYRYRTPSDFSDIVMNSDGEYLTGLWFERSDDESKHICDCSEKYLDIFKVTCGWLDAYFAGVTPGRVPEYKLTNATPFRKEVMGILAEIRYGTSVSYGDIARIIASRHGVPRMSAQAVGGAVGWNPMCIIIPCHRVLGADRTLVGYGGGLDNKMALLNHEGIPFML